MGCDYQGLFWKTFFKVVGKNRLETWLNGGGYNGAIKDQGEKTEKELAEITDEYWDRINGGLDDIPHSPEPEREDSKRRSKEAVCEYECELVSMGVYMDRNEICLYGNCKLKNQIKGPGICPTSPIGFVLSGPSQDAGCDDKWCDLSKTIIEKISFSGRFNMLHKDVPGYIPHSFAPFD